MHRLRSNPAFTLLELVLVMVVLCVALAITVPSLRGWSRGLQVRDAADQFVAVARRARTLSISEARVYRLNVDAGAGTYRLTFQDGENYVATATAWGRSFEVPQGVRMTFAKPSSTDANAALNSTSKTGAANAGAANSVDFGPTGASDPATVTFASDAATVKVQSSSPAEVFVVVAGAGGRP